MGKSNNNKLNKKLKITFIIFLITVIITLFIILNKGVIFGVRLVSVTSTETEETHTIQIVAESEYIPEDGEVELYINIDGIDAEDGYELISSDEDIISIDGNVATGEDTGTATITAKSTDYDISSEVTLKVVVPITKLTVTSEYSSIDVGEETQLAAKYSPSSDDDVEINLKYTSTDESIAKVDTNGVVTGISEGTVTIMVTDTISGKSASCSIEVES